MSSEESDRFEYETLRPERGETKKEAEDPKAELNELAAEGWRFVGTIDYTGGGTKYLLLERRAGSAAGEVDTDGGREVGHGGSDGATGEVGSS